MSQGHSHGSCPVLLPDVPDECFDLLLMPSALRMREMLPD